MLENRKEELPTAVMDLCCKILNKYFHSNQNQPEEMMQSDYPIEMIASDKKINEEQQNDEEDDDLVIIKEKEKEESDNKLVPDTYICFKCKSVGKHWIMDCDK